MKKRTKEEDYLIICDYRAWSEETYCAGFMSPDRATVQRFRARYDKAADFGDVLKNYKFLKYEQEMLDMFWELEEEGQ